MQQSIQPIAITVQASDNWTSTEITLDGSAGVTIAYQTGLWTADPTTNSGESYDAKGCPNYKIDGSDFSSYPLHDGQLEGALVGRVGDSGTPFLIGNGPTTVPQGQQGTLWLVINDDLTRQHGKGLTDNQGSVTVYVYPANTAPDLSAPLVVDPPQTAPGIPNAALLGPLQYLLGTWTNQPLGSSGKGGTDTPFSYNVMPLPQKDPTSPLNYILKNSSYYEELTFTAIHGPVLNRGGIGAQVAYTVFYSQRVYFADGQNKDALVHAENGSLLLLGDLPQPLGPYGNGNLPGLGNQIVSGSVPPTQEFNLVKQVAVPHGNSILALGSYTYGTGAPDIPIAAVLPTNVDTAPYHTQSDVTNPNPTYALNPNQALVDALAIREPDAYIKLTVSSANGKGAVTNIGFEQQHANVASYDFTYWLESLDEGISYTQLQYSQTISLQLPMSGGSVSFPHVTVNTLTKKSS
ncbi:heme-binding protein [Burkholderia pyrrocinia]|uniref:heme-binding protein n=1 Tax=Burkholderia pyrrocinia TaxID=60550 RepID=UPI001ABACC41|nr:heme-binding protein [Burkholderia pyrrocinia]